MHDDDRPIKPEPEPDHEGYWTEAQWERFMLENERLMDRYEQVQRENPDKDWKDPLDLYYKVHYDLDVPEGVEEEPEGQPEEPEAEEASEKSDEEHDAAVAEPPDGEIDDFRQIPAYQLAFEFAKAALDYMKGFEHEQPRQSPLRDQFYRHALRIAADIAGGHGLGYEEDSLCGNIVKNRWALGYAQEAHRLLKALIDQDGSDEASTSLLAQLPPIIKALEQRIAELRAKVWWDTAPSGDTELR